MAARFEKGQKVIVRNIKKKDIGLRDSTLEPYAGQIGTIDNYYWMTLRNGNTVYLYIVRLASDQKEVVLHEDELRVWKK